MTELNNTMSSINSYSYIAVSPAFIGVTILVAVLICLTLFILYRNFRRAAAGAGGMVGLSVLYSVSTMVSAPLVKGDSGPAILLLQIVGFIVGSIIVGFIMEKVGIMSRIDRWLESDADWKDKPKKRRKPHA